MSVPQENRKRRSRHPGLPTHVIVGIATSVLAGLAGVITAGISATDQVQVVPPHGREPRSDYRTKIIEAQEGLSEGLLVYTILSDAKAGDSLAFEATLYGATGRKAVPPKDKDKRPAPSGALMGVQLHCSGPSVRCVSNSSEKKPVLRTKDDASWSWTISTPKAGKAVVNLTVTAYLDDTDTVIAEPIPVRQEIEIQEDKNGFLSFMKSAWKEILAALTALGGVGGLVAFWQTRRSSRSTEGTNGGDDRSDSNSGGSSSSSAPQPSQQPTNPSAAPGNQEPDSAAPA
ncbi:hypothetical protein [Streptomyces sp. TRM68367]|uniref:hypothetical protein n=1 Tax=Streptomyces sp. TRM68367 TaxID=2758415 RepID=UPI00165A291D|nr:hypothetical protein [Streptomyces sp. TRM68367]MBC9726122.1 hypothetical protein [Streptomyces sp. TRM68367]